MTPLITSLEQAGEGSRDRGDGIEQDDSDTWHIQATEQRATCAVPNQETT